MAFQMGADSDKIRTYLRNGNDWREPLCRGSYGISVEEGRLEGGGRVAFRYCDPQGNVAPEANPNGSRRTIAGIYNETGTVLGLMPHPERLADPALSGTDGAKMFKGLVESLAA